MSGSPWQQAAAVVLWGVLGVYGLSSLWWLLEVSVLSRGWQDTDQTEVGLDAVQLRVLTIAAERTVQATVDTIPDAVSDRHVIAERPVEIDGAEVHTVPDGFECEARRKGRAIEWARRAVPCEKEYVLYLDEDSMVGDLTGLPAGDVVQLSEHPLRTGSRLSYLCEIFRIGYQLEQRAFHRLSYPAYAWGGGVAVRHELEDQITWNVPSITEDTTFIWRAADEIDIDYRLTRTRVWNQAPPTLSALIGQRRRWVSGTVRDLDKLPRWYQPVVLTRIAVWAVSPLTPLLGAVTYFFPGLLRFSGLYLALSALLLAFLSVYMILGLVEYRTYGEIWWVYILGTPLAVTLHSLGALWGIVDPVDGFEVTQKTTSVDTETIRELNQEVPDGDTESRRTGSDENG